jgi:hypothetical protein
VLEGRLAVGESCTVYRGRWVVRLGEQVVIKVLTAMSDADLLRREWSALKALQRSEVAGASHYVTRLPVPVAHGLVDSDRARPASVFGWKSGFVHTLEEVGQAHPDGVSGPVLVWLLKRLLELLGFVHRSGFVHGAVHPDHVLVHPRDHGAVLVGWTLATPWSAGQVQELPASSRKWAALYDEHGRQATPALDIAMACQIVRTVSSSASSPVERVLQRGLRGQVQDAWALRDELVAASQEAYGPAAYHPLSMPGWRTHGVR